MAGFSDYFENEILDLLFTGSSIDSIAENAATSPSTELWFALHTADPTDSGTQGSNEVSLTGYARVAVARTSSGFSVVNNSVRPAINVDFPQLTSTSTATANYATIGLASAVTSGEFIASGSLEPVINLSENVIPRITTASSFTLD